MKRRTFLRSTLAATAAAALPRSRPLEAMFRPVTQVPPDLSAVTGDSREVVLSGKAIADLAARMKGPVLLAGDDGYDESRTILNPAFDKHPALVARVTGTADVRAAVDFARENDGLLLAVKCGGHSASGKSTCDSGLQIDLSDFRNVRVDPVAKTARVTGGSLLGQLDHESMAYGLATPMGTVSHTGVGGLVTGGGFGRVARHFGLSIDNLLSVDVVSADGQFRRASADENADLFWGVRGGGGNFGVVTSFEFRLHPMSRTVLGGDIFYPISRARDFIRMYGDYAPGAPDALQVDFVMVHPPGGAPGVVGCSVCYSGPPGGADAALAPLRSLGTPLVDDVRAWDYVELQQSGDVDDPRAQTSYLKAGFVPAIPDGLAEALVDGFEPHPGRTSLVFVQQSGGAINRVPTEATAFPHRDVLGNLIAVANWPFGEEGSEHVGWARAYWGGIEPFTRGFYVNDSEEGMGTDEIRRNYRQNHERLVRVKNTYDPENLFRLNANIEPTA